MSNLLVQNIKHTNGTTAQTIDSSGRVTFPQRIAFMGKKTDTSTLSASSSTNVTFNATDLAHASWDGTTFTAPIAGVYRFVINGHKQSLDANPLELAIFKNGSQFETAYSLASSSIRTRNSCEAILLLSASDTITFRVLQGDTYAGGSANSSGLMCAGHFIG
tara:strand:- start:39 stop:524 length:486 start_codon:yes stop_codon:yes gene_type:complete